MTYFVKTLTAHDKYSLRSSEKLQQLIQIKLSKKVKTFSQYFAKFP